MSSSGKNTKQSRTARAAKLAAGAQQHFASNLVFKLASEDVTAAQVVEGLETLIDLRAGVAAAKAQLALKLLQEEKQAPALCAQMDAFEAYVRTSYSKSPDVLGDFGLQMRKAPAPLTADQQTVAVAKRAATRKARGTTGKRAKLRIKGEVTGVTITPVKAGEG